MHVRYPGDSNTGIDPAFGGMHKVIQDIPDQNSFMAEMKPHGQRKKQLYQVEEHRGGYAYVFEEEDLQGHVPDVQRSRIGR
ncbi:MULTISPECIES: hypothetical protein [unclassified Methanoculleus]|jgi:hypothetical protein|uniref:Uncharacterized protein n=1 Tax=Methanoculleus palmolei TaxID=72612 RepID=A0ABD8A9A7_9EURY|nr:hypothetical protein [Methanoculleus sp. UBA377]WOX56103.1 hypothetical protein R6Y95_01910 [Methanoculleus palmolei]